MRETWVPFFQDIRQSSMWAYDAETFKVWMTLLTMVDPEGFICAAIPGIAIAANIPITKVREAMALFEAPDPDSRSQEHEGRRVERVPRGWLMLGFEEHRERAKHEAEKARKRRWARANRVANDTEPDEPDEPTEGELLSAAYGQGRLDERGASVAASSENVDASKSKSKSKSFRGGGNARPITWFTLEGWELSPELRAEAIAAGVTNIDDRIAGARIIPIGGVHGTTDRDGWVRAQFGRWRTWAETDRAKAQAAALAPQRPPGAYGSRWEPTASHKRYAERHGLPIVELVDAYRRSGEPEQRGGGKDADEAFAKRLVAAAKARDSRTAAKH
jgi:hypothetical protein